MLQTLLIVLVVFFLLGGFGATLGGWGGGAYSQYGMGGIGLGTFLVCVLIVLLVRGVR